jgi:hypothetical protein
MLMSNNSIDENKDAINHAIDLAQIPLPAVLIAFLGLGAIPATLVTGGIAAIFKITLGDMVRRSLSKRETQKVITVMSHAIEKIQSLQQKGLTPRFDDLADSVRQTSESEEILEGVLLKSKNEHEEKKLKILGNIFANTCFLDEISFRDANIALSMATNMTYTKICVLALLCKKFKVQGMELVKKEFSQIIEKFEDENLKTELPLILLEIKNLMDINLINQLLDDEETESGWQEAAISNGKDLEVSRWQEIIPRNLYLSSVGRKFARILSLEDIPDSDLIDLYRLLSEPNQVKV